jgi:hypothetical protein
MLIKNKSDRIMSLVAKPVRTPQGGSVILPEQAVPAASSMFRPAAPPTSKSPTELPPPGVSLNRAITAF